MMLWRKAWRESRVRFLVAVATMAVAGAGFLVQGLPFLLENRSAEITYTSLVDSSVYGSTFPLLFVIMSLLLGLGGLLRERSAATAAFTLALQETRLLVGPLPWFTLLIVLLVSTMVMMAGVRLTDRRDF